MIRRLGTAIAVFGAIGGGLAGCASAPQTAHLELPEKNLAQFTLPLDQWTYPGIDRTSMALNLLAQECIEKAGYPWPVVTDELWAGPGESWNAAGRKLFDPYLADKYGYGNSNMTDVSFEVQQRERDINDANAITAQRSNGTTNECFERASKQLGMSGDATEGPHWFPTQLGFKASTAAKKSKPLAAATERWRACLTRAGVGEVEATPNDMPGPSVRSLMPGPDEDRPIGAELKVPAEERRIAVADAKCRESSGWAQAEYDALWDAEAEEVRENADEIQRQARRAAKLDKRVESVIASHAPTAG